MNVKISAGNMKLGRVPNLSMPPGLSCRTDAPCFDACYARKNFRRFKEPRAAWTHNLELWTTQPRQFHKSVSRWLTKHAPRFFRWHVAGDIPSPAYIFMMNEIAREHPGTKFLAFTKRYEWVDEYLTMTGSFPANLTVVLSAWPGWNFQNAYQLPVAWMQDGTENRYDPDKTLECHGGCVDCGMCWNLRKLNRDVVFHKH